MHSEVGRPWEPFTFKLDDDVTHRATCIHESYVTQSTRQSFPIAPPIHFQGPWILWNVDLQNIMGSGFVDFKNEVKYPLDT